MSYIYSFRTLRIFVEVSFEQILGRKRLSSNGILLEFFDIKRMANVRENAAPPSPMVYLLPLLVVYLS